MFEYTLLFSIHYQAIQIVYIYLYIQVHDSNICISYIYIYKHLMHQIFHHLLLSQLQRQELRSVTGINTFCSFGKVRYVAIYFVFQGNLKVANVYQVRKYNLLVTVMQIKGNLKKNKWRQNSSCSHSVPVFICSVPV